MSAAGINIKGHLLHEECLVEERRLQPFASQSSLVFSQVLIIDTHFSCLS